MSNAAAKRLWLALVMMPALACLWGCVSTDSYQRSWDLRSDATPGGSGATTRESAGENAKPAKRIAVGMTKSEVRNVGGSLIEESSEDTWTLKQQFHSSWQGPYLYYDSREMRLYFDDADRLAAIIVRGSYNVYP